MKKLTITEIGTPKDVQTKFGMKAKNSLKAKEYNTNWLGFWCNAETDKWKVGDEVSVEDVTSREYNGKTYYDIKTIKASTQSVTQINELLTRVMKIQLMVEELVQDKRAKESVNTINYPTQPSDDGIPF